MSSEATLPKLEELAGKLDPPGHYLIKPGRKVLAQGFLRRQGRFSVVDRWCFLMTDLFLFTEPNKKLTEFKSKQQVDLRGLVLDLRRFDEKGLPLDTSLQHTLQLIASDDTNYLCGSNDRDQVWKWAFDLQRAISSLINEEHNSMVTSPFWYHHCLRGTIHSATMLGDTSLLESILSPKSASPLAGVQRINDVDQQGNTCLHIAAQLGNSGLLAFLMDLGADVSIANDQGQRAIHLAALEGHSEAVELILTVHGKEATVRDAHGVTPLALCVLNGKHESVACVPVLIAHGANPNQTDSDESESGHQSVSAKGKSKSESVQSVHHLGHHQSLLHTLASTDRVEMARVLLKEGARLDTTNLEGQTPLHIAVDEENEAMCKLFLEFGAPLDTADYQGDTPLFLALKARHPALVLSLIDAGVQVNLHVPANPIAFAEPGSGSEAPQLHSPFSTASADAIVAGNRAIDIAPSFDMVNILISNGARWPPLDLFAVYSSKLSLSASLSSSAGSSLSSSLSPPSSTSGTTVGRRSNADKISAKHPQQPQPESESSLISSFANIFSRATSTSADSSNSSSLSSPSSPANSSFQNPNFPTKSAAFWKTQSLDENQQQKLQLLADLYKEKPMINLPSNYWQPASTMVPDECSDCCMICRDEFTLLNRRHHCRRCGLIVCNLCSFVKVRVSKSSKHSTNNEDNQSSESENSKKTERVCTGCFNHLSFYLATHPVSGAKSKVPESKKQDSTNSILQVSQANADNSDEEDEEESDIEDNEDEIDEEEEIKQEAAKQRATAARIAETTKAMLAASKSATSASASSSATEKSSSGTASKSTGASGSSSASSSSKSKYVGVQTADDAKNQVKGSTDSYEKMLSEAADNVRMAEQIGQKSTLMVNQAAAFSEMAKQMKEAQAKKSWWEF